jgi:hypothetical protein
MAPHTEIAIFVTVVTATAWSMGENPRVLAEWSAHLETIEMGHRE